jgi:hypothetical protein
MDLSNVTESDQRNMVGHISKTTGFKSVRAGIKNKISTQFVYY